MVKIDIFDKALGDAHQLLVTPELVEKEINPRLAKGWTLTAMKASAATADQVAVSQGKTVTFDYLQKQVEKEEYSDLLLKAPMTAG
jgi:hypothetical protein